MTKPTYKASGRRIIEDAEQVLKAVGLLKLGARIQVVQGECPALSWDRVAGLYREVNGVPPPKGLLPFSVEWYMSWRNNIHASLFYNIYLFLKIEAGCERVPALSKAFRLYMEHCAQVEEAPVLDITRAWMLVRFFDGEMLQMTPCCSCGSHFVAYKYDPEAGAACRICRPPSRAVGERRKSHPVQSALDLAPTA